jgi:hypothetical protein
VKHFIEHHSRKGTIMELGKFENTTVVVNVLSNEGGHREGDIYTENGRVIVIEVKPGHWTRKSA